MGAREQEGGMVDWGRSGMVGERKEGPVVCFTIRGL